MYRQRDRREMGYGVSATKTIISLPRIELDQVKRTLNHWQTLWSLDCHHEGVEAAQRYRLGRRRSLTGHDRNEAS